MTTLARPAGPLVAYIESDGKPGHFYRVTPTTCSCEHFRFRLDGTGTRCKHQERAFPTPEPVPTPAEICAAEGHAWLARSPQASPWGEAPRPARYAVRLCRRCGALLESVQPPRPWSDGERQQEDWR